MVGGTLRLILDVEDDVMTEVDVVVESEAEEIEVPGKMELVVEKVDEKLTLDEEGSTLDADEDP